MIPSHLLPWALKYNIPHAAVRELMMLMGTYQEPAAHEGGSESAVQSRVRLAFRKRGGMLWRNNVGALQDKTGRVIRYGLLNDSKKLNETIKSADLIGIEPVLVTRDLIGSVIGRFVSLECKEAGWVYSGTDREEAQARWAALVTSLGGRAKFAASENDIY